MINVRGILHSEIRSNSQSENKGFTVPWTYALIVVYLAFVSLSPFPVLSPMKLRSLKNFPPCFRRKPRQVCCCLIETNHHCIKVEPYHGSECKPQLGALKTSISLTRAMEEAQELLKLTLGQRLEKCVFRITRSGPNGTPTTSDGITL